MTYDWYLRCPECGDTKIWTTRDRAPAPHLNCGECLMDDAKVVELDISGVTVNDNEGDTVQCG